MGWYGPQGDCGCCGEAVLPCLSTTGSWSAASGTWTPTTNGATCSSAGSYIYTPTSGVSAGERQGMYLDISGASEFSAGYFFDADDEDNCHRVRITRTASNAMLSLERVTGGSATTLDQWDQAYPDIGTTDFWVNIAEFARYVGVGQSSSLWQFTSFFPRDASYTKRGGPCFGFFADSFSSPITLQHLGAGTYGRSSCALPVTAFCGGGWPGFNYRMFPHFNGSDEVNVDIPISGFSATAENCSGADSEFWGSHVLGYDDNVSTFGRGLEDCGWRIPGAVPATCSGGGYTWGRVMSLYRPATEFNYDGMQEYISPIELRYTISSSSGGFSNGAIDALWAGVVRQDSFESGASFDLELQWQTYTPGPSVAVRPFTGDFGNATVTVL